MICSSSPVNREWGVTQASLLVKARALPVAPLCLLVATLGEHRESEPGQPFSRLGTFQQCCGTHTGEKKVILGETRQVLYFGCLTKGPSHRPRELTLYILPVDLKRLFRLYLAAQNPIANMGDLMVDFSLSCHYPAQLETLAVVVVLIFDLKTSQYVKSVIL